MTLEGHNIGFCEGTGKQLAWPDRRSIKQPGWAIDGARTAAPP